MIYYHYHYYSRGDTRRAIAHYNNITLCTPRRALSIGEEKNIILYARLERKKEMNFFPIPKRPIPLDHRRDRRRRTRVPQMSAGGLFVRVCFFSLLVFYYCDGIFFFFRRLIVIAHTHAEKTHEI